MGITDFYQNPLASFLKQDFVCYTFGIHLDTLYDKQYNFMFLTSVHMMIPGY